MPARLEPGGAGQTVALDAHAPLNDTGVEVKPGQIYRIDVGGRESWWGVLGRHDPALGARVGRAGAPFQVRAGESFEAPADGILYLFERDAVPWYARWMGTRRAEITRVR